MNRRQKIIVSITGITLVLLILLGLTYGYFLTRIQGNSNAKSISAVTANLSLEYRDGNGSIIDKDNITPGMEVGTKTFSVYNSGDGEVEYAVIIDNVKITDKTGETETRLASNDFVYTLTCSSSCNGQDEETILPLIDNGLLVTNKIASKATQTYTITVKYKDTGIDQSADMGKKVEARVNIEDIRKINPYYNNTQTLAYNIINNAVTTKNGTEFKVTPDTKPLEQKSGAIYDKEGKEDDWGDISVPTSYQFYYWTYGTGYTIDATTGLFTLTDVHTCKYNDGTCNQTLVGKYLVSSLAYGNSNSSNTAKTTTNLTNIYKVIEAPESSTSTANIKMKANKISAIPLRYESELSVTDDDYGTSYYYRGMPEDNYVNFASMCWRIVRIQGDGSIKLILASEKECSSADLTASSGYATDGERGKVGTVLSVHYGYKYVNDNNLNDYVNSTTDSNNGARNKLNSWLTTKITGTEQSKLKDENWCIGDLKNAYDGSYSNLSGEIVGTVTEKVNNMERFYYTAGNRFDYLKTPKLKCETTGTNGEIDKNKIGMLTMDEVAFAGGGNGENPNYYLNNNAGTNEWWSLSLYRFQEEGGSGYDYAFGADSVWGITGLNVSWVYCLRPVVILNPGTTISEGTGIITEPYIIN